MGLTRAQHAFTVAIATGRGLVVDVWGAQCHLWPHGRPDCHILSPGPHKLSHDTCWGCTHFVCRQASSVRRTRYTQRTAGAAQGCEVVRLVSEELILQDALGLTAPDGRKIVRRLSIGVAWGGSVGSSNENRRQEVRRFTTGHEHGRSVKGLKEHVLLSNRESWKLLAFRKLSRGP